MSAFDLFFNSLASFTSFLFVMLCGVSFEALAGQNLEVSTLFAVVAVLLDGFIAVWSSRKRPYFERESVASTFIRRLLVVSAALYLLVSFSGLSFRLDHLAPGKGNVEAVLIYAISASLSQYIRTLFASRAELEALLHFDKKGNLQELLRTNAPMVFQAHRGASSLSSFSLFLIVCAELLLAVRSYVGPIAPIDVVIAFGSLISSLGVFAVARVFLESHRAFGDGVRITRSDQVKRSVYAWVLVGTCTILAGLIARDESPLRPSMFAGLAAWFVSLFQSGVRPDTSQAQRAMDSFQVPEISGAPEIGSQTALLPSPFWTTILEIAKYVLGGAAVMFALYWLLRPALKRPGNVAQSLRRFLAFLARSFLGPFRAMKRALRRLGRGKQRKLIPQGLRGFSRRYVKSLLRSASNNGKPGERRRPTRASLGIFLAWLELIERHGTAWQISDTPGEILRACDTSLQNDDAKSIVSLFEKDIYSQNALDAAELHVMKTSFVAFKAGVQKSLNRAI